MTWNRLDPYGESVKPLTLSYRERSAPLDEQAFDALDSRELLNDRVDDLYGDRYLDPERFFSPHHELPPHMTLRRS